MPIDASVITDKIIIPAAAHPVNPISSLPILHKEKVTQITNKKPKTRKIVPGKTKPKTVKDNIIIA